MMAALPLSMLYTLLLHEQCRPADFARALRDTAAETLAVNDSVEYPALGQPP